MAVSWIGPSSGDSRVMLDNHSRPENLSVFTRILFDDRQIGNDHDHSPEITVRMSQCEGHAGESFSSAGRDGQIKEPLTLHFASSPTLLEHPVAKDVQRIVRTWLPVNRTPSSCSSKDPGASSITDRLRPVEKCSVSRRSASTRTEKSTRVQNLYRRQVSVSAP